MSRFLLVILLSLPLVISAAEPDSGTSTTETTEETVEAPASDSVAVTDNEASETDKSEEDKTEANVPGWVMILGSILMVVVTVLGGFLKKKWGAEESKAKLDSNKSLLEQKNFLIDNRLIPFAISTAEHWLLTQLMPIVKDVADGNGFQWKTHFDSLKNYVKTRVVKKFASENIDIIEQLGERELDNLLDRILTKIITKLPDNIQAFLPDSLKSILTEKASEFLVDKGKDLLGVD